MLQLKALIFLLAVTAPSLYAQEKNRLSLDYQYFQNDINQVTATPETYSLGFTRIIKPRLALGVEIAIQTSDGSASELFSMSEFDSPGIIEEETRYTVKIKKEMQINAELYLFDQFASKLNPYLNLGISSIESELRTDKSEFIILFDSGASNRTEINSSSVTKNTSSSGLVYGAGILYKFFGAWGLQLEYLEIAHDVDTRAKKFSVGVTRNI